MELAKQKARYQYLNARMSHQEYVEVKRRALDEGIKVADLIATALREYLARGAGDSQHNGQAGELA